MKKLVLSALTVLAVLAVACGEKPSTTETPQGTAKLWLQAALAKDNARVQELSTAEFRDRSTMQAEIIREKYKLGDKVKWAGSGQTGEDYDWTATGGAGAIFMKVRKAGAKDHKVADVSTSW